MGERVPVYSDVFEDIDADEVKRYDFKHKTDSIMKFSFFFPLAPFPLISYYGIQSMHATKQFNKILHFTAIQGI